MRRARAALALAAALVAGCATPFQGEVTTFHQWQHPHGETIRVLPRDPEKLGSLEFRYYRGIVAARLEGIGYRVVPDAEPSQYVAELDYAIDTGRTEVHSWPRDAVWYHFHAGYHRDPFYYGYWNAYPPPPEVYSYTVYTRQLWLTIRATPGGERGSVVYEGRVHSVGRSSRLQEIMPYMIEALFTNFPGESGLTKIVTVESDSGD